MKVGYSGGFFEDLIKIAKRESKLENKITKSEKAGHISRDIKKHPHWKKRWKEFCKYDMDWDYIYLFEIIIHKLELMYEHFKKYNCEATEDLPMVSLKNCIEIGKRILADEYGDEADKFMLEIQKGKSGHMVYYIKDGQDIVVRKEYDKEGEFLLASYNRCMKWLCDNPEEAKKYDDNIYRIAAFSEITDEEKAQYRKICEECIRRKNDDVRHFFDLISDNIQSWWD